MFGVTSEKYCWPATFSVLKFSRISDFGTFYEVWNSQIFLFLQQCYANNNFLDILEFANFPSSRNSRILPDLQYVFLQSIISNTILYIHFYHQLLFLRCRHQFLRVKYGSMVWSKPNLVEGDIQNVPNFGVGLYQAEGPTLEDSQVASRTVIVRPKTPFSVSSKTWSKLSGVHRVIRALIPNSLPSEHEALIQCSFNVGPTSSTSAQQ